jgi:HAMP domain-containing protein
VTTTAQYPHLVNGGCAAGSEGRPLRLLSGRWRVVAVVVGGRGGACRRLARILAPVTRMVSSGRSIPATDPGAAGGALSGDELEELGRAFNELLDRLQEAFEAAAVHREASHQLRRRWQSWGTG